MCVCVGIAFWRNILQILDWYDVDILFAANDID